MQGNLQIYAYSLRNDRDKLINVNHKYYSKPYSHISIPYKIFLKKAFLIFVKSL